MNRGFTLIELLMVIGIIGVLAGVTGSNYLGVRNRVAFENQVNKITADLRWTMSRSLAQESDDQWGIRFSNATSGADFYEIWHGANYESAIVVDYTNLHGSVAFSDPASGATKDIIFLKSTGLPLASSTLELYSLSGNSTGTVEVNTQGRIDFTLN